MKILSLVKNIYTNDARVHKTVYSLLKMGHQVEVVAVKEHRELPIFEVKDYKITRIPLFSSIYSNLSERSVNYINKNKKKNLKFRIRNKIKKNKLRLFITEILNSISYLVFGLCFTVNNKFDLIYANDLDTLFLGYILAKLKKSKIIYDSHEIWLESIIYKSASFWKKKFWSVLENSLIRKLDFVITTTDFRADYLEKKYNLQKVFVIKNCPPFNKIEKSNILRKEFAISDHKKILLYQGLLDKRRGLFNMVDIVKDFEDLVLVFIGDGPDKRSLFEYVRKNKLEKKVFLKDKVHYEQLPEYTASADIGLQLLLNIGINHYSTISNKIFEYIMAGIAVLASDFPEIRKIVKGNNLGKVVEPNNYKEVKKALTEIIENLELYKTNALKVKNLYSWEEEEHKLKTFLEQIT